MNSYEQHEEGAMSNTIFSPITMGKHSISNRMVMAPMTRNRAPQGLATPLMVEYYTQRATAGLIITEGAQISEQAVGYPATPGIYNADQVICWRQVTDAVHSKGGRIFVQLWHCGRISHPDLHHGEILPVAPSAIQPVGEAITFEGMKPFVTPRALDSDEIGGIVAQYRHAATCAMEAGFDGVEIHAANGYLIDQFLCDRTNQRHDQYGGTIENRSRFLLEIAQAVGEAIGMGQVGIRISPVNGFNDISDSDPQMLFNYVAKSLGTLNAAYLHVVEVTMTGEINRAVDMQQIRTHFGGIYIASGGYDKARGNIAIADGCTDMVAYGVPFLANPDLPQRFLKNASLNTPDPSTFYGGDTHGYTDYPALAPI